MKDPKHKPKHVVNGSTNFADFALGTSFNKKYKQKAPAPVEETKEEVFTLEKPPQLFYADIIPGYAEMT